MRLVTKSGLKVRKKGLHWDIASHAKAIARTGRHAHLGCRAFVQHMENNGTTLWVFGQASQLVSNTPRIQSLPTVHGVAVQALPLEHSSFLRLLPVSESLFSAIYVMTAISDVASNPLLLSGPAHQSETALSRAQIPEAKTAETCRKYAGKQVPIPTQSRRIGAWPC